MEEKLDQWYRFESGGKAVISDEGTDIIVWESSDYLPTIYRLSRETIKTIFIDNGLVKWIKANIKQAVVVSESPHIPDGIYGPFYTWLRRWFKEWATETEATDRVVAVSQDEKASKAFNLRLESYDMEEPL